MELKETRISDYFEEDIDKSELEELLDISFTVETEDFPYEVYPRYYYDDIGDSRLTIPDKKSPRVFKVLSDNGSDIDECYKIVCNQIGCYEIVPYKEISYFLSHNIRLDDLFGLSDLVDYTSLVLRKNRNTTVEFFGDSTCQVSLWVKNSESSQRKHTQVAERFEGNPGILSSKNIKLDGYKLMTEDLGSFSGKDSLPRGVVYIGNINRIVSSSETSPNVLKDRMDSVKSEIEKDFEYEIVAELKEEK